MDQLIIEKEGQRKPINPVAWELMGENKNGWTIVANASQTVSNEVKNDPPDTGAKKENPPANSQTVSNEVKENGKNTSQTVSNEMKPEEGNLQPSDTNNAGNTEPVEASKEFKTVAEDLTAGPIKDFLDLNQVPYKSNAKKSELIDHLAGFLKNNVELLKIEFGL